MSHLYVVATPIGNLEDVSRRALAVLASAGTIAAEDTRTARILLKRYGIQASLISYTEHNRDRRIPEILERLQQHDVALVCDAGTPGISDPGVELVDAARTAGHGVVPVPGASAVVTALSAAGLRAVPFAFLGFLPRTAGDLRRLLDGYAPRRETLVAFESPQRLLKSLAVFEGVLPGRRIAVCRELTKLHEEIFVGSAAEAIEHFREPRGEIVLVVEGGEETQKPPPVAGEAALREEIAAMRAAGLTRAQAESLIGRRYELSRRRFYGLWLE
jgi:16S rRNA (cytidine1402-2'-O)-methyltransferase